MQVSREVLQDVKNKIVEVILAVDKGTNQDIENLKNYVKDTLKKGEEILTDYLD